MKSGINGKKAYTTTSRQEKKSWCAPILCDQERYANSQRYVIRKYVPIPKDSKNRDVQIIYQSSLFGNMFTRDSRKVLDILKELTLGTDYDTCIKGLKCGRKEMQELQYHYDSTPEGARRKQVDIADLRKIFHKNETSFTFVFENMVFRSTKSKWSSIYYTRLCHQIQK